MKHKLILLTALSFTMSLCFAAAQTVPVNNQAPEVTPTAATTNNEQLKNDTDKLSYSIGVDLGKGFKNQNIDINVNTLVLGLSDAINEKTLLLSDEQRQDIISSFQKTLMAKRNAEFMKKSEENKVKGEEFLNQNKTKAGVITLPSGLQYKVITEGKGVKPRKDDTVTVDYTGTLISGEVFDSSEKTGKPATFKVSQVISGWTEALQLMPAGSTWEVYIPPALAYGPRSVGAAIGPNETLVFKIHLISVKKEK